MWKKIIAGALCAVIVIGIGAGAGFYAFARKAAPKFKGENLAKGTILSDSKAKSLTDFSSLTAYKLAKGQSVEFDFGREVTFNSLVLQEKGDNVLKFRLYKQVEGEWEMFYEQDRILSYRLCTFEPVTTQKLKIEMTDCTAPVSLRNAEIYNLPKSDTPTKVSQYLVLGGEGEMAKLRDEKNEGFSGYYDVVTDVIVIGELYLDENANVCFFNGEKVFADNLQALKDIIGDRKVRIWTTMRFDQKGEDGKETLDATMNFINAKSETVAENVKAFTDKYDVYGVDYDWEYPQNRAQWKAYDKIIKETAKVTKVSVAIAPWGSGLSRSAIKNIEHVNIMAYDMFDKRGDHANIEEGGVKAVFKMMCFGYKKEQLLMGIPTYGRTTDGSAYAWPCVAGNEEELGKFNSIVKDCKFTDDNGVEHTYDGYVQSYAEARDKMRFAQEAGLGGVMIFRAKCDAPYTYEYSIHRAVKNAIDGCPQE